MIGDETSHDNKAVLPPFFVLFADGTLWSYDIISDVALGAVVSIEDLRAWDSTGRNMTLIEARDGAGVGTLDAGTSGRADLMELLAARLRKARVRHVEQLSFDEMVFKASIRLVAPKPGNAGVGVMGRLVEGLLQFLGGTPASV